MALPTHDPKKIAAEAAAAFQRLSEERNLSASEKQQWLYNATPDLIAAHGAETAKHITNEMQKTITTPDRSFGKWWGDKWEIAMGAIDGAQQPFFDAINPDSDWAKENRAERAAHLENVSEHQAWLNTKAAHNAAEAKKRGEWGISAWLENAAADPFGQTADLAAQALPAAGLLGATYLSGGTLAPVTAPALFGMGAVQGVGGARGDLYQATMQQDDQILQQHNAEYRKLRESGVSEAEAKAIVGTNVRDHIGELTGAAVSGAALERFGLGKALRGQGSAIRNFAAEIGSEAADEGVQTMLANNMKTAVNPNQSLTEDLALAMFQGGIMGGMSGSMAAALSPKNTTTATTPQDAADRILQAAEQVQATKIQITQPENHANSAELSEQHTTNTASNTPELQEQNTNIQSVKAENAQPSALQQAAQATTNTSKVATGSTVDLDIGDTRHSATWEIREASDLGASIDKAQNQFRDRTRAASQAQIQKIAAKPDYRYLGDSPTMDFGAPTLAKDGNTIIGGNGRTAGVKQAYAQGTAEQYRLDLLANAEKYGFTAEQIAQFQQPVLTRRLNNHVNVEQAAIASNEGGGLVMSALEQAKADATRLPPLDMFTFSETGSLNTGANRNAIAQWVGQFPQNQQAALQTSDGMLSQTGLNRLQNAMLYQAYGDSPTLARQIESTDSEIRNIGNALTQSANTVAQVKTEMTYGNLHDLDIADDLTAAADLIEQLRADGTSVADWLAQEQLIADIAPSPEARLLVQFFDAHIRSPKAMREMIAAYYAEVQNLGNPNQADMFGEKIIPTKQELLRKVMNHEPTTNTTNDTATSSPSRANPTTENAARQSGNGAPDLQPETEPRIRRSVGQSVESTSRENQTGADEPVADTSMADMFGLPDVKNSGGTHNDVELSQLKDMGIQVTSLPYARREFMAEGQSARVVSGQSEMINIAGRLVVLVDMGDLKIPFYRSTGLGGKKDVQTGKWYPIFGIGADGWFNKTKAAQINDYYGSPALRQMAELLDTHIEQAQIDVALRQSKVGTNQISAQTYDLINQSFPSQPTENGKSHTAQVLQSNIDFVVNKLADVNVAQVLGDHNSGSLNTDNGIRYSRTTNTQAQYEQRIDELFAGASAQRGTRVLDRSDIMDMLGYGNAPLVLSESHLRDNLHQNKHPEMTAEQWKKVPEWIDNPIIAYENKLDNNKPNRIVLVAPETIGGRSVLMAIEPQPKELSNVGNQAEEYQLLVTVFAKDTPLNVQELVNQERLRYVDMKKAPDLWRRVGSQFSKQSVMNQRRVRILTERNLQGYRKNTPFDENQTRQSQSFNPTSDRATPQQIAAYKTAISGSLKNHAHNIHVVSRDDLVRPENAEKLQGVEGFYNPTNGQITLIAESLHSPAHAQFVAWHELAHRKIHVSQAQEWHSAIAQAAKHETVRKLADKIQAYRKNTDDPAATNRAIAHEEAIAELYAAHETGDYAALKDKYDIKIPRVIQNNLGGFLARLGDKLARIWRGVIGHYDVDGADVFNLLRDLSRADVSGSLKTESQNPSSRNSRPHFGVRADLFDLPPIPITRIDTSDLPNNFKDMKILADKLLRDLQSAPVGTLHNNDMGVDLKVSKKDRQKMGDNTKLSHATSQSVTRLTDLVKHAIRAESHADVAHQNENVVAVHRLYAPVEIDGKIYRVKLTVKDYVLNDGAEQNNLHAIEAAEIENAPMGTLPASAEMQKQVQPTSGRELSITDLMRGASQNNGEPFSGSLNEAETRTQYSRENNNETVIEQAGKRLARIAQAIQNGAKYISNEPIHLGSTPDVLVRLGVPQRPMRIVDTKKLFQTAGSRNQDDHGLTPDVLGEFPKAMQNPLAVFDSATQENAKVLVVELKDSQDRPIIAAIHVDKRQGFNQINKIASIYGRNNAEETFNRWTDDGLLRYLNDEKSHSVLTSFGLQLPTEKSMNGMVDNVLRASEFVNSGSLKFSRGTSKDQIAQFAQTGKMEQDLGLIEAVRTDRTADYLAGKKTTIGKVRDFLVEGFADNLIKVSDWIDGLPIAEMQRELFKQSMYRAGGMRDYQNQIITEQFIQPMNKELARIAKKTKRPMIEVKRLVGVWGSANYAPTANARLLQRAKAELDQAKADGASQAKIDELQAAYNERQAAINGTADGKTAGGYSNPFAAQVKANIEKHLDVADIKAVMKHVHAMLQYKLDLDLKAGRISQEMYNDFKANKEYVPLTGDPISELQDENDFIGHSTDINQSRDKQMGGRSSMAEDAIDAAFGAIGKSTAIHGWSEFKNRLNDIYETAYNDQIQAGKSPEAAAKAVEKEYGMTREKMQGTTRPSDKVIIYQKAGQYYEFRLNDKLTAALHAHNTEAMNAFLRPIATVTRGYARLVTQFTPSFAPVNAVRDMWEKSEMIRTFKAWDSNGNRVDMDKVARGAIAQALNPSTMKQTIQAAWRNDFSSEMGQHLREFLTHGGVSTQGTMLSPTEQDLLKQIKKETGMGNIPLRKVFQAVESYNTMFDLVPSFSLYMAMRKHGISAEQAAGLALDTTNFRKKGKYMSGIKAIYMFAQPIATGAYNLARYLDTPTGKKRALAYVAAGIVLYSLLREMADEDEGGNKLDQMGDITRYIPIHTGNGKYIKIPVGFGLPQFAWNIATNSVKAAHGDISIGEAMGEIGTHWAKTIAPIAPSEVPVMEYPATKAVLTFTPSIFQPIVQNALNRNAFGTPIAPAFVNDKKLKAEQSKTTTAQEWRDMALWLQRNLDVDMHPEQIRNIVSGYAGGIFRDIVNIAIENPNAESLGKAGKTPFINALYGAGNEYAIQNRYFAAMDEAKKLQQEYESRQKNGDLGDWLTDERRKKLDWYKRASRAEQRVSTQKSRATRQYNKGAMSDEAYRAKTAETIQKRLAYQKPFLNQWRRMESKPTSGA